jgi:outer membrane receptor protein involved in Fe transport
LALGMVTSNPLHAVEIGSRGVLLTNDYGNHVLLLVNGHMLNEAWDNTAYYERGAGIPMELVDHIEVVLGPGSVLYGSNAMLGVINIVTKRAKDFAPFLVVGETEIDPAVNANVGIRTPALNKSYLQDVGSTWRIAGGLGQQFTLFGQRAELVGELEYYTQNGPTFAFGPQNYGNDGVTGNPKLFSPDGSIAGVWGGVARNSYYSTIPDGHARLLVGDLEIEARAESFTRSTPYTNFFNGVAGDFDAPIEERDRFLGLHAKHTLTLSPSTKLMTRIYGDLYDYYQHSRTSAAEDCPPGMLNGCRINSVGASRWAGVEPQLSIDWLTTHELVTTLGLDARLRHVGAGNTIVDRVTGIGPPTTGAYQINDQLAAFFFQQEAQPFPWLSLNGGIRADVDPRIGSHLSPRAAAALDAWPGGTLKLIYAEAFRSPSAFELYYADPRYQLAAAGLRPESVRSIEASIEQRFFGQRLYFGAFRSWWHDMVLLEQLSDTEVQAAISKGLADPSATTLAQYRNISELENWGLNAAFNGTVFLRHLRYGATITAAHTRRVYDDGRSPEQLTVAPSLFGNLHVAYDLWEEGPVVALAGSWIGPRLADRALDGGFAPMPEAPMQFMLRATISGPVPWINGMSYRLSANLATATRTPYVAGPTQAATDLQPAAELAPVIPLQMMLKLEQRF